MSERVSASTKKSLEQCETLSDRLQWVLDEMAEEVGNASTWALAAGLNRGTVSRTIQRGGGMRPGVVKQLADVAGISRDWLLYGEGGPDEGPAESADPYPARVQAIRESRAAGLVSRSAMVAARKLHGAQYGKYTAEQWHKALLELTVVQLRRRTG